ncbi:MAG: UDP-N-acetylglucosamine 1-carboxyvinyltransferase, partial [Chitinophagales bacterium]|nr:UDP-N-acetylglucosamine 1-carboxyvinyltransferase [Chitinophagales bacterium]
MNLDTFEVYGGKKLKGEIIPQGAKNEALQIISAVLLTDEDVTIHNIPDILDVNNLIELLESLGVSVNRHSRQSATFNAGGVDPEIISSDNFKKRAGSLRGSVLVMGPMLSKFKKAFMPQPGGDKIGRRRLDTHFNGFKEFGAEFDYNIHQDLYSVKADKLVGKKILLEEPSVTGTANMLMCAVLAEGVTQIYNAACEPYIQQLCRMLNAMGAKITGIGSNLLTIEGVKRLHGTTHKM